MNADSRRMWGLLTEIRSYIEHNRSSTPHQIVQVIFPCRLSDRRVAGWWRQVSISTWNGRYLQEFMLQYPQRSSPSLASDHCGAHHQLHSFGAVVQARPVERDLDLSPRLECAIRDHQNARRAHIDRTSGPFPLHITPHSVLQAGHEGESILPAPFLVAPVGRH